MKVLLQRVTQASVVVEGRQVSAIGAGLLVFLGLEQGDCSDVAMRLMTRLIDYRLFPDDAGRMNRSVAETGGDILLVSQFTLAAETSRGRRPGFSSAMRPPEAETLYAFCLDYLASHHAGGRVAGGVFGADMQVALVNDGPVTFLLTS